MNWKQRLLSKRVIIAVVTLVLAVLGVSMTPEAVDSVTNTFCNLEFVECAMQ